jgi:hypothetical protein
LLFFFFFRFLVFFFFFLFFSDKVKDPGKGDCVGWASWTINKINKVYKLAMVQIRQRSSYYHFFGQVKIQIPDTNMTLEEAFRNMTITGGP